MKGQDTQVVLLSNHGEEAGGVTPDARPVAEDLTKPHFLYAYLVEALHAGFLFLNLSLVLVLGVEQLILFVSAVEVKALWEHDVANDQSAKGDHGKDVEGHGIADLSIDHRTQSRSNHETKAKSCLHLANLLCLLLRELERDDAEPGSETKGVAVALNQSYDDVPQNKARSAHVWYLVHHAE